MIQTFPKFIDEIVFRYLQYQISTGHPVSAKNALQRLCTFYRQGFRVHPNSLSGIETIIVGLCHTTADPKVRRWSLNALAQIGTHLSMKTILRAIEDHAGDPEIVTAGVAALYKISPSTAISDLHRLEIPSQIVTLAALQHADAGSLDLVGLPVNVQIADPETIKAALLIVGLNRAPPHLFDPNYTNGEMVKVVGSHDNPIVSQYSIWAITENPFLDIDNLGVSLSSVQSRPANVRSWVYRLISMNEQNCLKNLDFVKQAMSDSSPEARLGLAQGIKETFFESLIGIVLNWFTTETDNQVSQEIIDHLIIHAGRSAPYHEHAIEAYKRADQNSRSRMRATAAKTSIYSEFRRIDYQTEGDLLMTGPTYNFNNSQIGAFAGSGTALNTGPSIQYPPQVVSLLRDELLEAENKVASLNIPEDKRKELTSVLADAKTAPNTDKLRKVISALSTAAELSTSLLGGKEAIAKIIGNIRQLAGFG